MSFLMTATPISMHIHDNMSLNNTSFVIQLHIISMFLPAFITGNLIKNMDIVKLCILVFYFLYLQLYLVT